MNEFRYIAELRDEEDYQYLIGKFDDDNGNSIKIFINENGTGEKILCFDDVFFAKEIIRINMELVSKFDFENFNDKDVEELIKQIVL